MPAPESNRPAEPPVQSVPVELLAPEAPPLPAAPAPPPTRPQPPWGDVNPAKPARGPSVHPIAALLLLVIDNLWNLADWTVIGWVFTIPLSFVSVALPTFILQKKRLQQSNGKALGWAMLLGTIAAVPFSVGGTTIGGFLLAWLGISRLSDKPAPPLNRLS